MRAAYFGGPTSRPSSRVEGTRRSPLSGCAASAFRLSRSASRIRLVCARSAADKPRTATALTSFASGTSFASSARPRGVRNTFRLRRSPSTLRRTTALHRPQRRERRRRGDTRLVGELALRKTVRMPKRAQISPVSDRHIVLGEANLQRAMEGAHCRLHDVRKPFAAEIGRPGHGRHDDEGGTAT